MDLSQITNERVRAALTEAENLVGGKTTCSLFEAALRSTRPSLSLNLSGELSPAAIAAVNDPLAAVLESFHEQVQMNGRRLDKAASDRMAALERSKIELSNENSVLRMQLAKMQRVVDRVKEEVVTPLELPEPEGGGIPVMDGSGIVVRGNAIQK